MLQPGTPVCALHLTPCGQREQLKHLVLPPCESCLWGVLLPLTKVGGADALLRAGAAVWLEVEEALVLLVGATGRCEATGGVGATQVAGAGIAAAI